MTFRLRNTSDPMPKSVRLYSVKSLNNVENSKKTTSKSWELSLEDFLKKNPTLDEKYYNYLKEVFFNFKFQSGYFTHLDYQQKIYHSAFVYEFPHGIFLFPKFSICILLQC